MRKYHSIFRPPASYHSQRPLRIIFQAIFSPISSPATHVSNTPKCLFTVILRLISLTQTFFYGIALVILQLFFYSMYATAESLLESLVSLPVYFTAPNICSLPYSMMYLPCHKPQILAVLSASPRGMVTVVL